jgi:hypothetical protein
MRLAKKISFLPLGRPKLRVHVDALVAIEQRHVDAVRDHVDRVGSPIFVCTSSARNRLHEVSTAAWLIANCSANAGQHAVDLRRVVDVHDQPRRRVELHRRRHRQHRRRHRGVGAALGCFDEVERLLRVRLGEPLERVGRGGDAVLEPPGPHALRAFSSRPSMQPSRLMRVTFTPSCSLWNTPGLVAPANTCTSWPSLASARAW